jgi:1,4-alpha-glucan branching enzyme
MDKDYKIILYSISARWEGLLMEQSENDFSNELMGFVNGENFRAYQIMGAHQATKNGRSGFIFRVWAPNAQQVSVVGDFNQWEQPGLIMQKDATGIWSLFTTQPQVGQLYKYNIKQADGREVFKIDPFAQRFEKRPQNAAILGDLLPHHWHDGLWRGRHKRSNYFERPLNIYEVHASSWKQHTDGSPYTIKDLTHELIPYLQRMHYSHVEFMPLMEHPLGASWGYQLIGYFAFCSYYGTPEDFQEFVERCHAANIGVLVDWVPGHFCRNADTLPYYDGTATFEYQDNQRADNPGWGTLNFDLAKPAVQSFLISSAMYWLETFHLDGIRVDAVSNMIYLDYGGRACQLNQDGSNRDLAGWSFLRKLNQVVKATYPQALMMAEESTADTKVTGMLAENSLGFDYKWNMGWMNDVLKFFEMDPIYRKDNLNLLTFSWMYRQTENFILPLSHDEVVHGKRSLMHKMWGDRYRQFAQLRTLYAYQMVHPGKKLLFMGSEWGQFLEWKYDHGLEWVDLNDPLNQKMQLFTKTLNEFYLANRALWEIDDQETTLEVIDADNTAETVLSFIRHGKRKKDFLVVAMNFTPVERRNFRIGVPYSGSYQEVLNTEMQEFGGTWVQHNIASQTGKVPFKQYQQSITTTLPAFGTLILQPEKIILRRRKIK